MPSIPQPLVPEDDGRADSGVAAALTSFSAGTASASDVLAALSRTRLLVPVVALLTSSEVGEHGLRQEKESEMALPKLVGNDGREAVPAFTSAEALARWRADARPIQVTTEQVCEAALGEKAAAVVLDVAGPIPFVIEGAPLAALGAAASAPGLHEDPEVLGLVKEAVDTVPEVVSVRLGPGYEGDLAVRLRVADGADPADVAQRLGAALSGRLSGRLTRGIEIRPDTA
ncbi:SseB family protein [Bailinhaonella thermotolerans]|uniref:SseB family protein n=1 Tax=Bailinhaonella thermotolerans TaxID=1070861 RepID=A0A3A4BJ56_9ACTN|nr:SseB family protein [Bailinhaonella thermotolerans]RJL31282.1 SseB family protein [Bailinhaonella thermotolerans]